MTTKISKELLRWYDKHARKLPWRIAPSNTKQGILPDPYRIWLSEIMLQQTQVATVQGYYNKFLGLWPTIHGLAAAEQDDVMKAWAGLGYYSRARNLKKCADIVATEYGGLFPQVQDELQKLPGIGPYTSAAIAAIAFQQPVPVVDGNVERVFSRLFQLNTPLPAVKSEIHSIVSTHLDRSRPGDFAQACMDLGATICLPKNPQCLLCPVSKECGAFNIGDPMQFPKKLPKKNKPLRKGSAFVAVNRKGAILLRKRPQSGLLAGMTTVPTTDWSSNCDGATGATAAPFEAIWNNRGIVKHTFTHFHLEMEVWHALVENTPATQGRWVSPDKVPSEALPTVFKKVLELALPGSTKPRPSAH